MRNALSAKDMILFASSDYSRLARSLLSTTRLLAGQFQVARFSNGELHLTIETEVRNKDCLILGSIMPPDEQLLSLALLAHTLKKEGARQVTGLFPYLAYSRHDKNKPMESMATPWAGSLLAASGIDQIITVDVHSETIHKLFPIPVRSLSPAELLAKALNEHSLCDATIIAPDEGAIGRGAAIKVAAGVTAEVAYFEKHRTTTGVTQHGPIGAVGPLAVIVDDILDTGGTLVSACELLVQAGVREIHVVVTHGLFTGEEWKRLWDLRVRRIICTDSVPMPTGLVDNRIVRVSVRPLLEVELLTLAQR